MLSTVVGTLAPTACGSATSPVLSGSLVPLAGHARDRHRRLAARLLSGHLPLPASATRHAHRDPGSHRLLHRLCRDRGDRAPAHLGRSLEEAAMDLGANEWQAFRCVTLPAILPGVIAAALLAFIVSFDDYVITSLVAGVDSETLPMVIYAMARRGVNPVVNAVSALIVFGLGALILISERLQRNEPDEPPLTFSPPPPLAGCARDPRPRLNVFNWSDLHRSRHHPQLRARVRLPRPLRHLRKQRGDAGPSHERQLRLGHRVPHRLPGQAHARQRTAGPTQPRPAPEPRATSSRAFQQPAWDPACSGPSPIWSPPPASPTTANWSPPPAAWADLWSPRLRGRITMLDDPFDVMGACLKKLGFSINATDPAQLRAGPSAGHRAEAAAARLSERRSARPARERRRAGRADVEHHRAAGHGRLARDRLRLSVRRLRRVSGLHGDSAREQAPGAGAQVHRLHAAPARWPPPTPWPPAPPPPTPRPDSLPARGVPQQPGAVSARPTVVARGEWAATLAPATQRLRDRLWTEIKSA